MQVFPGTWPEIYNPALITFLFVSAVMLVWAFCGLLSPGACLALCAASLCVETARGIRG